jgi:hypothetical protein
MPVSQDQGDQLELPRTQMQDGAQGADSPGTADRPARGSAADLRHRLERLPQGHPSSPYHDDGTPKPPLAQLKNLELPLPGEEREPNGGMRRDASAPRVATPRANDSAAVTEADAGLASYPDPDVQDRQPAVRESDPAGPNQEPERREPGNRAPAGSESSAWDHLAVPGPTWDRPTSQEATRGQSPEPEDQSPEPQGQSPEPQGQPATRETNWGQSPEPQDQRATQKHEQDAPGEGLASAREDDLGDDEPATQDQPAILGDQALAPADQTDARRGEQLTPEQVRLAVRTLGQCRLAEGRSVFGSYGDSGLTPAMRRIEDQLEHGELVPETEKYALKSLDRFQEKLAKLIARFPGDDATDLAARIHDGIRYTFLFETDRYVDGIAETRSRLTADGHDLIELKPSWDSDEYKGVNSRWRDSASGVLFEIQWHTAESWEAKQKTHEAYEKIHDLTTPVEEVERLRDYQSAVCAEIPVPPGALQIRRYKKES